MWIENRRVDKTETLHKKVVRGAGTVSDILSALEVKIKLGACCVLGDKWKKKFLKERQSILTPVSDTSRWDEVRPSGGGLRKTLITTAIAVSMESRNYLYLDWIELILRKSVVKREIKNGAFLFLAVFYSTLHMLKKLEQLNQCL